MYILQIIWEFTVQKLTLLLFMQLVGFLYRVVMTNAILNAMSVWKSQRSVGVLYASPCLNEAVCSSEISKFVYVYVYVCVCMRCFENSEFSKFAGSILINKYFCFIFII